VLGDETLRSIARRGIARELVETVRKNVTIDCTLRKNVRAPLRVLLKRILRKHGYPPDKQEKATQTVLEQAALLSAERGSVGRRIPVKTMPGPRPRLHAIAAPAAEVR